MKTRVYKPISEQTGFFQFMKNMIADLPEANALGYRLAVRNIRARYRQSVLGLLWAIFPPLATSAIWIFLNSSRVVKMEVPEIPYPVFVFCGTIIWQAFAGSVMGTLQSVSQNQSLLVKINFPREAVFIAAFYEILFNALVSVTVAIIFVFSFGIIPDWTIVFYLPMLFVLILLGISIGLFLLPVGVLYKDIQFGLPIVLQFLMYLTPVVYVSADMFGLGFITDYNPLAYMVNAMRASLTEGSIEIYLYPVLIIGVIASALLLIGFVVQRVTMEILVERMGS